MPRLEEKLAFLSRPHSYPESTQHVVTKETHMSWIFLTATQAWKLKKPSLFDQLDLRSLEARRRNCDDEVRLNRRLAPDVYRGVVPLTLHGGRKLQLEKPGIIDDWLVCMRRLPADRMLDEAILNRTWSNADARRVGALLADFYSNALPVSITTEDYVNQLKEELQSSRDELTKRGQTLSGKLIQSTITNALMFIEQHLDIFRERVQTGKLVEGHGDLRPEHICLENKPVIIDCLEFNRNLRILDRASEMMFLKLECDRLGAPAAGETIFRSYCEGTGDQPPDELLGFYRAYHGAVRAKVAIWHLKDHAIRDVEKWIARAEQYLKMAA